MSILLPKIKKLIFQSISLTILYAFIFSTIIISLNSSVIAGEKEGNKNPVSITSDNMTMKNIENKLIFQGKVILTKEDLTLNADQVVVSFSSSLENNVNILQSPSNKTKNDISMIEAYGNVKVDQGDKKAKSENAIYYQDEDKVVLTGSPEAWEQGYKITGEKITIFLKENRSLVEESHVTIYPK